MARGEGINKIKDLFFVYTQRLQAPQRTVIQSFCEVVEELLGVPLETNTCRYAPHTRTITCTLPGPIKTEILLRKKEILTHITGRLGVQNAPKDIL